MVRMRSPVQARFAAPFFLYKKSRATGGILKYVLFLEAFDVVFRFTKAEDKLENVWQKDEA